MGASGSINKSIIQTDVITEAYSKCPNVVASNELDIKNVTFKCNSHCGPNCKIVFSQDAGIDATCLITNLQDVMAETISKMNADAQTGLGLAVTKNKNETKRKFYWFLWWKYLGNSNLYYSCCDNCCSCYCCNSKI